MVSTDVTTRAVEVAARLRRSLLPLARELRRSDGKFTPTELSSISTIHHHEPISLGELAARERLSPSMITRLVVTLEKEGIIERETDPNDRRVCRVRITASGNKWIERSRERHNAWLVERLAALEPDELTALATAATVLERFVHDDY